MTSWCCGLLGAFFQSGFLFLWTLLSYFDQRRTQLLPGGLLLFTNGLFTFVSLRPGFPYYGYGYFLSAAVVFACAFVISARLIGRLPCQIFVRDNTSVNG